MQLFYEPVSQLLTVDVAPRMVGGGDISHRWDDGVNAGFIDYQLNYGHYSAERYRDAERRYSLFAEWNTGLNLGAWRLRYQPIYQKDAWGQPSWHTEKALAYRDLKAWRALLSIGDNHTPSTLFDNVKYRGIQLASDDRMLPESLRQFSPWIRGMARSNAEIKVRQNGEVIYQTFVSPAHLPSRTFTRRTPMATLPLPCVKATARKPSASCLTRRCRIWCTAAVSGTT
ncbi:hypothetical protein GGER_43350 [Serratia rubidaea]